MFTSSFLPGSVANTVPPGIHFSGFACYRRKLWRTKSDTIDHHRIFLCRWSLIAQTSGGWGLHVVHYGNTVYSG